MMQKRMVTELFEQLAVPFTGEALFDHMTDLVYFIKNRRGQYVVVNRSLVERCGFSDKSELIGRTADQVYPLPLGTSYRAQDDAILNTGEALLNRLELQIYPSHGTGWCLTNKIPLLGRGGEVVGLVGISKDLHQPANEGDDLSGISEVIHHIQTHFDEPLKIQELAGMAGLSAYQFEKRIEKIFEITPKQFVQKVRMEAAVQMLTETDEAIFQIALNCGYSDQSTFSRQFKQSVGLSPALYRRISRG